MSEAPQQQFQGSNGRSNGQELEKLNSQFGRIEASFEAIATQHQLRHRRLLALNWAAKYHGIPAGTFQKAFEMWLQASEEGGEI
jgi:hypothetical protein